MYAWPPLTKTNQAPNHQEGDKPKEFPVAVESRRYNEGDFREGEECLADGFWAVLGYRSFCAAHTGSQRALPQGVRPSVLDLIWTLCPGTGWTEGERFLTKNLLVSRYGPLQNTQN